MFLALKELFYNKLKFGLIISLIVLITYLVYFLTSLAYGLASAYTNGLNKIDANYIVLNETSNNNIMMSVLHEDDYNDLQVNGQKEKLGIFPAVALNDSAENRVDTRVEVFMFGIENVAFFIPNYPDLLNDGEVIADSKLIEAGYQIGDTIGFSNTDLTLEIVGFTNKSTFQTAPILYTTLNTWKQYRFNNQATTDYYNAILVNGSLDLEQGYTVFTIVDFANTLPGYTAQVLTFSMMIIFLIIIIAFVLGIFIYVLTIQKSNMFGVMKSQGISNYYISKSVVVQTILIIVVGAAIGLGLTLITIHFLQSVVPLAVNVLFYFITTVAFFLFAILGGLFSVSSIIKIDPLKAIGG